MTDELQKDEACCEGCKECCEECQKGKQARSSGFSDAISHIHVVDTVGASFLGILAVMLLIFLVRANKRNRELLLEVIKLQRQD
jgi:hypothetical protein